MVKDLQQPKEGSQPLRFDSSYSRNLMGQLWWLFWKVRLLASLQGAAQSPCLTQRPCVRSIATALYANVSQAKVLHAWLLASNVKASWQPNFCSWRH